MKVVVGFVDNQIEIYNTFVKNNEIVGVGNFLSIRKCEFLSQVRKTFQMKDRILDKKYSFDEIKYNFNVLFENLIVSQNVNSDTC